MPIIEIENLLIKIHGRKILRIDNLDIAEGQTFVLLGPNGAGKTTLLKTIMGFQRLASGRVKVLGIDLAGLKSNVVNTFRQKIGYVPQLVADIHYMPITVRQVVAIGRIGQAGVLKKLSGEDWDIIDYWINELGLSEIADNLYCELSGGQQKKTLIARAMAHQPKLLILDEPAGHLDLRWREQMVLTINHLAGQTGVSIMLVCHQLDVIPPCVDKIGLLSEGKLIASGSSEEVITDEMIKSVYGDSLVLLKRNNRFAVIPSQMGRD